jgi:hypothetical protein
VLPSVLYQVGGIEVEAPRDLVPEVRDSDSGVNTVWVRRYGISKHRVTLMVTQPVFKHE